MSNMKPTLTPFFTVEKADEKIEVKTDEKTDEKTNLLRLITQVLSRTKPSPCQGEGLPFADKPPADGLQTQTADKPLEDRYRAVANPRQTIDEHPVNCP